MRVLKKYSETNKEVKQQQKKLQLIHLLNNSLLPHITGDLQKKAHYLGYVIKKLLKVYIKKSNIDDRDSYVNKRIDLPGDLLFELYKPQMKKIYGECKKFFDSKNKDNKNVINVTSYIKPNIVEQALKNSLSTGNWLRRQGVAQVLQRITYLQGISFLRRVDAPSENASTSKLTSPRQVHPSLVGFLCVSQTPEHKKIGLTKHLTMVSSITIMSVDQYILIKTFLRERIENINSISFSQVLKDTYFKVFLNGEWLGMTTKYVDLFSEINNKKNLGYFDKKNVAVVMDTEECELKIYCDSGRLYRPVFKVNNNEILLKKEHIERISLDKTNKSNKITDWEEFMNTYPNVIEYIDTETQPYVLIGDKVKTIKNMHYIMTNAIKKGKNVKSNFTENRYDELTYQTYEYCDLHPCLLVGEITTNVPFFNYNDGSRNLFQYSQSRQAMGLYCTNFRHRTDISFILYDTQKPLVSTKPAEYTNSDIMASGVNSITAFCTYTGYNQEDSLIFNGTSIQRGKFRCNLLKKYFSTVQKNQATSQDDLHMKPDPTKVIGMGNKTYDKINDEGYAPLETTVYKGDIIIGKVTPLSETHTEGKQYKDSSETYNMLPPGIVDRVYTNIINAEGYEIRKMLIRSPRTPVPGDKYCCYDDKTEILTDKGWIFFKDLTTLHKVASLIDGEKLYYQEPLEIQEYDYEGNMYYVKNEEIDICVTPNHRMFYKENIYNNYKIDLAENIMNKSVYYTNNYETYDNINVSYHKNILHNKFVLDDELEFRINDWIKIYGYYFNTSIYNDYNIVLDCENIRQIHEIKYLLKLYKINYDEKQNYKLVIYNLHLKLYFDSIINSNDIFDDWIWSLNKEKTKLLIKYLFPLKYTYSFEKLYVDNIQKLCLHAGYKTIIEYIYREKTQTEFKINIDTANNDVLIEHDEQTFIPYKGKVYCCTLPNNSDSNNDLNGIVYVRRNYKTVFLGQSRHGQKGTIGILLNGRDMPFTKEGIQPDIIVNPNAIPSRMTIGQLCECLIGKTAIIDGMDADGTSFEEYDFKEVRKKLKSFGYHDDGTEWLYNGMTGEKMLARIFIGPTFYQRLKHLVEDKIHSRQRGLRTLLTRQPPEGRTRDGGLKLGEMEKDALVAHGISKFTKEKLLDNSDAYYTFVCDKCGLFAQRSNRTENKAYSQDSDIYYCNACNNYNDISKIKIPYALKLLFQELMSMCILPRIRTKKYLY
jgi:DNA-directed RNA polymerase beta subunit